MPFVLNGPGVEFLVLVIPCVSASAFLLYRELWTEAFALISLTISVSHVYHQNSVILPGTTPGHYRPKADSGVAVGLLLVPLAVSALSLSISPSSPVSEYFNIVFNLSLLFANVKVPLLFGRDTKEFKRYGFSGLASWVLIPAIVVKARSMFAGVSIMILSLAVQQTTLMLFVTFFKNSFTLGEAMVLSETLVLLCFDALIATLSMVLPSFLPFTFTIKRSPIHIFMHSLLFGMLLIGATLYQVLRRVKRAYSAIDIAKPLPQAQTKHIQLSLVFFSLAALIVIALIRPWTSHFLSGEEPFTWAVLFLAAEKRRIALITYWALMIAVGVTFAVLSFGKSKSKEHLNLKRKYFHTIAVCMFIPGYVVDPDLMHLAFSFALSALIMIEYVRHFRVWPAGMQIHTFLSTFLDQRDCGPVILSHLYLLLGCALPVWLNRIPNQVAIAGLSGVLTLGIGDTLASVIGQRFGKNKWFGTSKTIEGTLAFIISLLVSDVAITSIFFSGISIQTVLSSLLCACLTGILEATSDQNDNLVIPIFHLAIRNLF